MIKGKIFLIVSFAVVLAAIIAGVGVYFWQQGESDESGKATEKSETDAENESGKVAKKSEIDAENDATWEIIYSKDNGSRPTDHYLKGVLTISKDASGNIDGKYVVSDYNKVLERRDIAISAENFDEIIDAVSEVKFEDVGWFPVCSVGAESYVQVIQDGKSLIEAGASDCGLETTNKSVSEFSEKMDLLLPLDYEYLAFDGCGTVPEYASKSWYDDFIAKLKPEITADQFANLDSDQQFVKSDACLSLDGTMFVALIPDTEYLSGDSHIFRYEPDAGFYEGVDFEDAAKGAGFSGDAPGEPLHEFGKRVGDYIEAYGYLGDAGMAVQWDYRYYFAENRYDIVKHCSWTVDTPEEKDCDETL